MAKAPALDQRRLLDVQEIDTKAAQAQHRLDALPARAQAAALQGRVAELTARKVEAETAVGDLRREVTKAEDDVHTVRARAERDNARLMTAGQTPKELESIQSELEVLGRRQAALEEVELDAMQRLDDAEHAADGVVAELAQVQQDLDAILAQIQQESDAVQAELTTLAEQRERAAAGLDAGLVALYDKLRAAQGGIGAAALLRGACQGCHMSLNPVDLAAIEASQPDDIVRCEECGRILVRGA